MNYLKKMLQKKLKFIILFNIKEQFDNHVLILTLNNKLT